ncbi:MAG: hypothetical protein WKG06_06330 [Segetibacter sp.]
MRTLLIILTFFSLNTAYSNTDSTQQERVVPKKVVSQNQTKAPIENPIQIRMKEPILIKEIKDEPLSLWNWIVRIGGVFGLLVAAVTIYEKLFLNPTITSKIISFAVENVQGINMPNYTGSFNPIGSGMKYFLKFSINIVNANLNFQTIDIYVKYKNDSKIYTALKFAPRNFNTWTVDKKTFALELPQNELLYYQTNLEKDKTHQFYATFLIIGNEEFYNPETKKLEKLKENYQLPEYIKLGFT